LIALLQRVRNAPIEVKQQEIARINQGLLIFIGLEIDDTTKHAERLLQRIVVYLIFKDSEEVYY